MPTHRLNNCSSVDSDTASVRLRQVGIGGISVTQWGTNVLRWIASSDSNRLQDFTVRRRR